MSKQESSRQLIEFAREVLRILRSREDWGSDELGEIANAAENNGLTLKRESGDDDL